MKASLNKKTIILLFLTAILQQALIAQFYNNRNLRQQLKSGTYNKTLIIKSSIQKSM
jgi:hypothetical protein